MAKKTKRKRIKKTSKTNLNQLLKSNRISLFLGIVAIIAFLVTINSFFTSVPQQPRTEKPKIVSITAEKKIEKTKDEEVSYQVKKNDSLAKIGKEFCGNKSAWLSLAEKNNLTSPYIIHEGENLIIACQQ